MTNTEEQQFLNELEKKLWTSANKLLPSLDAIVTGLGDDVFEGQLPSNSR